MELPIQIISTDKTVRIETVQDLEDFNLQSLATQGKKRELLVSMLPAFKKDISMIGDDIVELSTENDALKNNVGSYDEK